MASLLVSAMAAAAVSILFSIYLFCKVRSLSTALVLVHQAKPAYSLLTQNPKLSFIYSKSADVTTPTPMIENIYNYMSSPLVYIILSVLATLFIVALVHILIRKAKRSHRTTLHIEIDEWTRVHTGSNHNASTVSTILGNRTSL